MDLRGISRDLRHNIAGIHLLQHRTHNQDEFIGQKINGFDKNKISYDKKNQASLPG